MSDSSASVKEESDHFIKTAMELLQKALDRENYKQQTEQNRIKYIELQYSIKENELLNRIKDLEEQLEFNKKAH